MSLIDPLLQKFTFVRRLQRHIARLENRTRLLEQEAAEARKFVPPGHFYSPLPSLEEIAATFERGEPRPPFPGIRWNEAEQIALLETFANVVPELPFPRDPTPGHRYHLNNPSYGVHDGIFLYGMLRHLRPRRIIEVGSGFSSAAMLDLNERTFAGQLELTFIDPDMGRLHPLLRPDEAARLTMIPQRVQEVPLDLYRSLERNDVLFIDSSHVSKVGSDVNWLLFEVLPILKEGVYVHIHDVSGNFEYPREWLEEGRAWNEQYMLRAFLMYNDAFRVVLLSGWLADTQPAFFQKHLPDCLSGGGQIWLRCEKEG